MRTLAGLGLGLMIFGWTIVPAAAVEDNVSYLLPDASDRYRPAIENGEGPVVVADIDSVTAPAASPNGQRIVFSGAVGDESLGLYALYLVNVDGSNLVQLTDGDLGEFDPTWSPDGETVAFAQNPSGSLSTSTCCRLATVDVESGDVNGLTSNVGVARPSYSAIGSFIVFDTPVGLYRINSSGSGGPVLVAPQGRDGSTSPDESQIVYLIDVAGGVQINKVASTGGSPTKVYSTSNQVEGPFWVEGRIYFLEFTGSGYDGRKNVTLRSVPDAGGPAIVEDAFSTHVVGLIPVPQSPAFVVGDADGDSRDDLLKIGPTNRSVLLSGGSDFSEEIWDSLSPRFGWREHRGGDFDGDGEADTASFLGTDGTWHVAIAESGDFDTSVWADFSTASGWGSQLVGDFDGDGDDDIANFHPSNGTWWVSRSTGSGFVTSLWADFSTASGWGSQLVGDFDGDGDDDIANFHPSNGTWWVSRSTGSGFVTSLWADFSTASGWGSQLVGDFDGDGDDDIANFHPSNGTWWVSRSTGSGFVTSLWADFAASSGWAPQLVGDFNGDGDDDIANYFAVGETWWVSTSTGSVFSTSRWMP